ncbi:hypothetical protein AB9K32_10910 [Allomuricauda sp. XS_ASV26]
MNRWMANMTRMKMKREAPSPIPIEGAKKMNSSGSPHPRTIHIQ